MKARILGQDDAHIVILVTGLRVRLWYFVFNRFLIFISRSNLFFIILLDLLYFVCLGVGLNVCIYTMHMQVTWRLELYVRAPGMRVTSEC